MASKASNHTVSYDAEIVVVGTGLVGLATAIALAEQGKSVILVDANKKKVDQTKVWDTRIYALTPATEVWLGGLEVWPLVDEMRVSDVTEMHLWHQGNDSPLELSASDASIAKLACIVENKNLARALQKN